MSDHLLLDFPVLQPNGGDFVQEVRYKVEAENDKSIKITHLLSGKSFVSDLLQRGEAVFSVQLLYRSDGVREERHCLADSEKQTEGVGAVQTIEKQYSYAPEIMPSIVVIGEQTIRADQASGLSNLWQTNEHLYIPAYSRIARHANLTFTSGDIASLMQVSLDEELRPGTMKTDINPFEKEGKFPVILYCSKDVFDELKRITDSEPKSVEEAMVNAIVTQALCAVYGYMHAEQKKGLDVDGNSDLNGVLQAHLEQLEEKTGIGWNDDNFNSGLAATQMRPYAIQTLRNK